MGEEIRYGDGAQVLQLLHANGYGPECYQVFLHQLNLSDYTCYLPLLRPLWKGTSPEAFHSWEVMCDDLIEHMDREGRKNVIGIGHSMGGITTWLAAIKRPDLFKEIILIDPVIMPQKFWFFSVLPMALRKRFFPIVQIALKRRDQWKDQQAIIDHLGSKKIYQRFDREVWNDFLNHSFVQEGDHLTLKYSKQWEAQIYATVPYVWNKIKSCKVPVTIIKAEYSDVISAKTWSKLERMLPQARLIEMEKVGHLMPFEKPMELCKLLKTMLPSPSSKYVQVNK